MSGPEVRRFSLSDDGIRRALRPGPDVAPPADFAVAVGRAIAGRSQRRGRWPVDPGPGSRQLQQVGELLLVIALLLALMVGAIVGGSRPERPLGGGPLFVARSGALAVIDSEAGGSTRVIDDPRGIFGVARSTGGGLVSFWTGTPGRSGTTLELVRADGSDRRVLAADITPVPVGRGGIDVWSADDRYLAAAVGAGGVHRILVVDVASGKGRLIGPDDGANNPLWSPGGEWIAFTHERPGRPNTLAIMRPDGSGLHEISRELEANVSGPANWSADGRWINFDAGSGANDVYRVDVDRLEIQRLTFGGASAAPALSPDDSRVAFLRWTRAREGEITSVWIMGSDGSEPQLLAENADIRGWSPDGRYVLVVTRPSSGPVQLLAITPDGMEQRPLLTLEACPEPCLQDLSWGWPRP